MKKNKSLNTLYLVVPCFNEEEVLPLTYSLFVEKINNLVNLKKINKNSKVLFVDDGSKDATWKIIYDLSKKNSNIEGISLSRNRGHQNALLAGLMEAKDLCDITITLDCDGQHDIDAIDEMLNRYNEGYDVIYGVRNSRTGENRIKSIFSEFYYKLLNFLGGEIIVNHADYRLVSSKVLNELDNFKEVNIFLRGLFPLVGFKHTTVNYNQLEREAGKSHYSISKMLKLAIDGITSLSIMPIRIIFVLGIIFLSLGLIGLVFLLINGSNIYNNSFITLVYVISVFSGIQLVSLGIIGEYVGKTYLEAKKRPRYIISDKTF